MCTSYYCGQMLIMGPTHCKKAGCYGGTESPHKTFFPEKCPGKNVFGLLWESPGQNLGPKKCSGHKSGRLGHFSIIGVFGPSSGTKKAGTKAFFVECGATSYILATAYSSSSIIVVLLLY